MKPKFLFTLLWLMGHYYLYAQKIASEILGKWDVWIPGAVTYVVTNDNRTNMIYQHGAAMNTLTIYNNGKYTWGEYSDNIKIVSPWYAQEGVTYYRISDARKNTYDFWYKKDTDQLIFLAGEVGGHIATGTRLNGKATAPSEIKKPVPTKEKPKAVPAAFKTGQEVLVEWSGSWYNAKILDYKDGQYKIHYIGWGSTWDEWVKPSRIKAKDKK